MNGPAPFHHDIAEGPPEARALWAMASDGVTIRLGLWLGPKAAKGTVFLLPGRSEYIEKYGRTADDFAARGYAMIAVDWRGQGLATRALEDPMAGHVADFAEYQCDLAKMIEVARAQGMPEPWHLLAHSMGGAIGLRCLMGTHPFKSAVFSAPMWGILIAAWMRPVATMLSAASRWFKFEDRYTPGTKAATYVLEQSFIGNALTSDANMWNYMRHQALAYPELSLGGPSLGWLRAALTECHALSLLPAPDIACFTGLGSAEKIVDTGPIHARMATWPRGRIGLYPGAEHELLMENPTARALFCDEAAALFAENS
jgi:lysophospholipase